MKIVSNASPLINLARIGQLDLLQRLYGELTVPEAVWREVVLEGAGQPGAKEVETASWIRVQPAANRDLVRALRQELDAG
jgi:predicted nucleic acid-binding protein